MSMNRQTVHGGRTGDRHMSPPGDIFLSVEPSATVRRLAPAWAHTSGRKVERSVHSRPAFGTHGAANRVLRREILREIDKGRRTEPPAASGLWRGVSVGRHVQPDEEVARSTRHVYVVSACAVRFLC
jgi:hypothetical protein